MDVEGPRRTSTAEQQVCGGRGEGSNQGGKEKDDARGKEGGKRHTDDERAARGCGAREARLERWCWVGGGWCGGGEGEDDTSKKSNVKRTNSQLSASVSVVAAVSVASVSRGESSTGQIANLMADSCLFSVLCCPITNHRHETVGCSAAVCSASSPASTANPGAGFTLFTAHPSVLGGA